MRSSSRSCRTLDRCGLTLLELVVVMSILAALAAILIPLFSNLTTQAHTAAAATNVGEVSKAVQSYNSQTNLYPNNLDSLIDGTGNLFTSLPSNQMKATNFTSSQIALDLIPTTPSASDVAALNSVGITNVLNMAAAATTSPTAWSPTFYPYGDGASGLAITPTATQIVSGTTPLAQLSQAAAQRLGLIPAIQTGGTAQVNTYYVFGLGGYSSMQGVSIEEAPVHWMVNMTMSNSTTTTTMNMSPSNVYSRFGLVFQTNNNGTVLSSAKFVGTVLLTGQGVSNSSRPMSNFIGTQS